MAHLSLALLGASSSLGQALLDVISDSTLRLSALFPLTTAEEEGLIEFRGEDVPEFAVVGFDWSQTRVLVNCQPDVAAVLNEAADAGLIVIDLTGLTSPGGKLAHGHVLSLPDPFAQQLATLVSPLAELGTVTQVTATGLLSVSTEGQAGIDVLSGQTRSLFAQTEHETAVYPKRIAYNILGGFGPLDDAGITAEETAAIALLQKQLPSDCTIDVTCTRTPHFFGHGASLTVRFAQPVDRDAVLAALKAAERVFVLQASGESGIAASQDAVGGDKVWVSRLRQSADGRSITLWSVADNTRLPALAVLQLLTFIAAKEQ
ncbi:Asd/ArgC dimerization domain-containing protein [Andreprevotia chitinilytica]|uniref:Asd/ArgC dimerization domain-containing protein n=1 Tax=Andreprevotia chitinilytica TaxID=396808 RepID=UPI000558EF97|nr:Asd/ArgC dimerization domain-containing protein [Andreprevotia chitinilytica]